MKREQRGDSEIVVTLFVGVVWLIGWLIFANWQCKSQASVMKMRATWGPVQGCMVEHKPDKWIAIERYRAIDD